MNNDMIDEGDWVYSLFWVRSQSDSTLPYLAKNC